MDHGIVSQNEHSRQVVYTPLLSTASLDLPLAAPAKVGDEGALLAQLDFHHVRQMTLQLNANTRQLLTNKLLLQAVHFRLFLPPQSPPT